MKKSKRHHTEDKTHGFTDNSHLSASHEAVVEEWAEEQRLLG